MKTSSIANRQAAVAETKLIRVTSFAAFLFLSVLLYVGSASGIWLIPTAALGLTLVISVFSNPFVGLILIEVAVFSGAMAGLEMQGGYLFIVALAGLAWVVKKLQYFDFSLEIPVNQGFFVALLMTAMLISVPFSLNQKVSMLKLVGYLKVITLLLLTVNLLASMKQLRWIIGAVIFTIIVSFAYGLYTFYLGAAELQSVRVSEEAIRRIQGLTMDPNAFAASIIIFLPLPFLSFFTEKGKSRKALWVLLFLVLVGAIVTTFSRGGLVSLGFILTLLMIKKRRHRSVLVGSVALLVFILMLIPETLWDRFSFVSSLRGETSARWRAKLLLNSIAYFVDNPAFGIGLGNFVEESIRFVPHHQVAHNMYLEMAAETGFLGLIALLGLIWVTIQYYKESEFLFKNRGEHHSALITEALRTGFYGFLFSALFLSLQQDVLFWAQLGFAAAIRSIADTRQKLT